MLEFPQEQDRQVIPRWRSFISSLQFGELKPLEIRHDTPSLASSHEGLLDDWQRSPSVSVACDVVSAAFALGQADKVRDVAEFVVVNSKSLPLARDLAKRCLNGECNSVSTTLIHQYEGTRLDALGIFVHEARKRLQDYPRNPVLWTNLALVYTILGNLTKAEQAIQVAIGLAPHNRFVVRAGCRFYLHQGDLDRAHSLLLRSSGVRYDPWLLSSEIAIASVRQRSSKFIRTARRLIDTSRYSEFHLSELASAIATLEAKSGKVKKARQLCADSMADPAENAVAQVAWLIRNVGMTLPMAASASNASHEAQAWTATMAEDWERALHHAKSWQSEQPFSSRPAIHGGMIATTMLEDFEQAEEILRKAVICNRDDATVGNNLAFALAKQGKVEEAKDVLARLSECDVTEQLSICITATKGLVSFRSDDVQRGRDLYLAAIDKAQDGKFEDLCSIAKIYLAIEELRCSSSRGVAAVRDAMQAAESLPEPFCRLHRSRLENALRKYGSSTID